jgi:hypothetical protein
LRAGNDGFVIVAQTNQKGEPIMSFTSWLRHLKATWQRPGMAGNGRRAARSRPGFRPMLDCLEDRIVPASLLVTSAADPGAPLIAGTLRYAVNQANQDAIAGRSDTITFDTAQMGTSTVTLLQGELTLDVTGAAVPVGTETIDGGGAVSVSGNNASLVFQVNSGVQAVLTGLTIRDGNNAGDIWGNNSFGGGIFNAGTLTVSNATLSGNSASGQGDAEGGAIYNASGGTLTVSNATLSGNSTNYVAGAIENAGTLTVSNATLSGNSAGSGGGAIGNGGTLTVSSSTLRGNSAGISGGAISNGGTLTLVSSTLSGNSATSDLGGGGGIVNGGMLTVSYSTFFGNSAGDGGGIWSQGTLTVSSCTFSGNSATAHRFPGDGGGAIFNLDGTLAVSSSTISGNSTLGIGGGIDSAGAFNKFGKVTLQSTIVAGNTAATGPDILNAGVDAGSADNFIGDGTGSGISGGVNGNLVGSAASRFDPRLAPLGDFGGPTPTMALLPGSPAIGHGAPAGPGVPTTDERGFPRPSAGRVDVGAFQVQPSPFVVTTAADPGQLAGKLSLREAVNLANAYATASSRATITFDTAQMGSSTVTLREGELVLAVSGGPVGLETIDGGGTVSVSGNHASEVFAVEAGVYADLTGLTIQDGYSDDSGGGILNLGTLTVSNATLSGNSAPFFAGGGIYNAGTLTVSNATLSGNSAFLGGGIYSASGMVTLGQTTLSNNAATSVGGGIDNLATLTLTDGTLSDNSAGFDGGIENAGTLTLSNATLSGNSAAKNGGGIGNDGTLTVSNTTLSRNSASSGGGIFNDVDGTLTLSNATLNADFADFFGGGIYNRGTLTASDAILSFNYVGNFGGGIDNESGTLTLTNVTLCGNSAYIGGGIFSEGGTLTFTNATVSGNAAGLYAGGIDNEGALNNQGGVMTLQSTIVAANTAPFTPDIFEGGRDGGSSYNLIGDGTGSGLSDGVNGNQVGSAASPLDPLLAFLGNYGGPTKTLALLPGSPAIGRGAPAGPGVPSTDQRGLPRPTAGPVDVGAFESQGFTLTQSGDNQSAAANTAFSSPLQVTVTANNPGEPVAGGVVTFLAPATGPSATLGTSSVTLTASGVASTTAIANGIPGSYSVTALVPGGSSATFTLTNLVPLKIVGDDLIIDDSADTADSIYTITPTTVQVGNLPPIPSTGFHSLGILGGNGNDYFHVYGAAAAIPVTLTGGTRYNEFDVYGIDPLLGGLTLHGRGTSGLSYSAFQFYDLDNPAAENYVLSAGAVYESGTLTRTNAQGQSDLGPLSYDGMDVVNLATSNGSGTTVQVPSLAAGLFVQIGAGAGENGSPGTTQVTVGHPVAGGGGTVQDVLSAVGIGNYFPIGTVQVVVDDSGDTVGRQATFNDDPQTAYGVDGLAPARIWWNLSQSTGSTVSVLGGTGNDTFSVQQTAAGVPLTIDGGAGSDSYVVPFGNLAAPLTIADSGPGTDSDTLTVQAAPGTNTITKTATQVTWGNPVQETVNYSGIENLTVDGSAGTNNTILDPGNPATTILGGPGINNVTLANTGTAGVVFKSGGGTNNITVVMGNLLGPVTLDGTTGTTQVTVVAPAGANVLTLTATQLTGAGQTINFNLGATLTHLTVNGSAGNNQLAVQGAPPAPLTLANVVPRQSVYVLNATAGDALSVTGNASLHVAGLVDVDSSSATAIDLRGNAQVAASAIDVTGGYRATGNAGFSTQPTTGTAVAADPLAGLSAPASEAAGQSVHLSGNDSLTLQPGSYSQITVSGNARLILEPGVYVLGAGGLTVTGNASVSAAAC